MSEVASTHSPAHEQRTLGALGPRGVKLSAIAGGVALVLAMLLVLLPHHQGHRLELLGLSYLTAVAYFLSISLGALFFVLIQHLTRAGWSVTVRRTAEVMAVNLQTLAVLMIPIVFLAPYIYHHWAHIPEDDPVLRKKAAFLNWPIFTLAVIVYFGVWIKLARYYWRNSLAQDRTADRQPTLHMQYWSGLGVVLFALTMMAGSWHLLMSLDPHWFSTMFGVYYFAGANLGFFAAIVVLLRWLQSQNILTRSVTVEHYHDLGKYLFGFVFFWGYIAYSQYMLIWYGSIPEEATWYHNRGATTHPDFVNNWSYVALALLFFHFLIPFACLLTRKSKRNLNLLTVFAIWMLLMHYIDLFWVVMPQYSGKWTTDAPLVALLCLIGVGGLWKAGLAWHAADRSLLAEGDPRLEESLAFENY